MKIPVSSELGTRTTPGAMTADEFLARFPEAPRDLGQEAVLREYVLAFGPLLRLARKPTPCCGTAVTTPRVLHPIVNDLAIYGWGRPARPHLGAPQATLDEYRRQPATFACTLVPRAREGRPAPAAPSVRASSGGSAVGRVPARAGSDDLDVQARRSPHGAPARRLRPAGCRRARRRARYCQPRERDELWPVVDTISRSRDRPRRSGPRHGPESTCARDRTS